MSADHPSPTHVHRRSPEADPLHAILESAARCVGGGVEWRGSNGLPPGLSLAAAPACERCRRTTPAFYLRCMAEVRPALGPGDAHLCAHGQGIRVTEDGRLLIIAPASRVRNFATHVESLLGLELPPLSTQTHLEATVRSLIAAVDAKDTYTRGHSERVHLAACALGEALGLDPATRADLFWASLLHDVGKIGAPDHILKKPGRLTPEEYRVMQEHPVRGDELLAPLTWLGGARRGVRHHHERFDGTGYPDRLAGEAIPLIARIISVADTFDAVISRRSYRDARDAEPAIAVLREAAGTQLDPDVVAAFIARFAAIAAVLSGSAFPPEGLRSPASPIDDASQRRAA
jgi:HD-GYP domain-containing protein (c-di-GMP phosphodiesterase class II)